MGAVSTKHVFNYRERAYEGEQREGLPHGFGSWGNYRGHWANGNKEGYGEGWIAVGSELGLYRGQWKDDWPNGRGTFVFPPTTTACSLEPEKGSGRYVGEWVNGVRQGRGVRYFRDGSLYTGQWLAGRPHGQGSWSSHGRTCIGTWVQGVRRGPCIIESGYICKTRTVVA